jgi:hypothetical protein
MPRAGTLTAPVARVRSTFVSLAVFVAVTLVATGGFADDGVQSPKRPVPNYDGRGPDPSNEAGAGTWAARALLSPLWFTTEWLIRRPLGAIMDAAEDHDLPHKLYAIFVFGPKQTIGFVPVGMYEFGFNPSVGIYGFWNDALAKRNAVRLHYEAWPSDWFSGSIRDRYKLDDERWIQVRVAGSHRPDMTFYGLGSRSLQSYQSRFAESRFDASATLDSRVWRGSHLQGTLGVRKVDVTDGHFDSDPNVTEEARSGAFGVPFGFGRDYVAPYTSFLVTLDTRKPNTRTGSGVRLEIESEQGSDVAHAPSVMAGWIRYGATAGATIDLNDHGRVLGLKVGVLFADTFGAGRIPFTELVTLGGDRWMHGYFAGRLVGQSAAVATLSYTWPIASSLDAVMEATLGNVFGQHLADFEPNLLRVAGALGFASHVSDPPLEFLLGFGSETFAQGGQIDAFRFAVGVPASF